MKTIFHLGLELELKNYHVELIYSSDLGKTIKIGARADKVIQSSLKSVQQTKFYKQYPRASKTRRFYF